MLILFKYVHISNINSKLVELFVKKQLTKYVEQNNILTEEQSGFRRKHSCEIWYCQSGRIVLMIR